MFRRRDVSALLETNDTQDFQESATPLAPLPAAAPAVDDLPADAPQPMGYAARPAALQAPATPGSANDKKTLADHFAEQARFVRQAVAQPPRQPQPATAGQSTTLGAIMDSGELEAQKRILRVGAETVLKGEISHCDRVVIEGQVEAQMREVETLRIVEGGSFTGNARVGSAEISGKFEGDLTVTGLLVIDETGAIKGKVAYGAIEIRRGGSLLGEIRIATTDDGEAKTLPFDLPAKSALRKKLPTMQTVAAVEPATELA